MVSEKPVKKAAAKKEAAFPLPKGHYYSVPYTSRNAHSGAVVDQAAIRAIQAAVGAEVTGIFSADTQDHVAEFQRKAKVDPSGVVDADTWKRLKFSD